MFCNVCVGKTATARLHFENDEMVTTDISATFPPPPTTPKSAKGAPVEQPFAVAPGKVSIPSHGVQYVILSFTPSAIQVS